MRFASFLTLFLFLHGLITTLVSSLEAAANTGYCGCTVDKLGMPVGWNTTDVWVDVVIILDTSEAMSDKGLIRAISHIESLIGDDSYDVLITDVNAKFYTRIGLITMSDTADVIYSLNMTKFDDLSEKVHIKKGVFQIDFEDAFLLAIEMFDSEMRSDRLTTRQIIYYISIIDPKVSLQGPNEFKASQGIIIVNDFIDEFTYASPGLKELASDGYYNTDIASTEAIHLFCKANCLCSNGKTPYRGASTDPAISAAGGCFSAHDSVGSWPKQQSMCAQENKGGLIVSLHDDNKAQFAQQLLAKLHPKAGYFWIGFSKSDDGVWRWEDQSTDSYTNWNAGEPSPVAVSKCAYADLTTNDVLWGAGNCQTAFPTVCEFAPCMVGYKCY